MVEFRKLIDLVTLTEMDWREKSPLATELAKYPDAFVHFSQINKLGINPKKSHSDPNGIYFYPVEWLLGNSSDRLKRGIQYGVEWPYYFVCDINWSAPGIVLSKLTWDELEHIAQRNDWMKYWKMATQEKSATGEGMMTGIRTGPNHPVKTTDLKKNPYATDPDREHFLQLPYYFNAENPGSVLWHFCDLLQKNGIMTWGQCFKGIAYIYDDGNSIIHNQEPSQLCVLDPRIVKMLASGKNSYGGRSYGEWSEYEPAIKKILESISQKYGGQITWTKKRPALKFQVKDKNFSLDVYERWSVSLYLNFAYGRAKGSLSIPADELRDLTMQQIIEKIEKLVDQISALDSDLLFEPVLPDDMAKLFVEGKIMDNVEMTWDTEIENPNSETDDFARIFLRGSFSDELTKNRSNIDSPIETQITISLTHSELKMTIAIRVNGQVLVNAAPLNYVNNIEGASDSLFRSLMHELGYKKDESIIAGDEDQYHSRHKFSNEKDWNLFMGWIVAESGITFGGKFFKAFEKQYSQYADLSKEDKDDLAYYIKRFMRKI